MHIKYSECWIIVVRKKHKALRIWDALKSNWSMWSSYFSLKSISSLTNELDLFHGKVPAVILLHREVKGQVQLENSFTWSLSNQ